jgi:murein DD-endopeptidase MepM/ murein hydrolase activator NlpD
VTDVRSKRVESPEECGCAPTPGELRALGRDVTVVGRTVTRRSAIGIGVVGVAAAGLLTAGPAFAAKYPSWDDVERAKRNQSSKAAEVTRIEGLIAALAADVSRKQAEAERLGQEYNDAQEAFEEAADRAASLQEQADAEAEKATKAADKLGRLAAQQYRMGGDDTSLELFFSGSAASADELLARLGTMDKLLDANRSIYADAVSARDNAQNLTNQADVARAERDRLQQEAEAKMVRAQNAATAAQAALDAQAEHLDVLEAQLAALRDTTASTVAGYREGVEARRRARAARIKREREAAARRAREAAERAREEAEKGGGGGGGGGGGSSAGEVQPSGWVRPGYGYISGWFGSRGTICANGYCTTSGHRGIDFAGGCSSPIYAAASGRVIFAGSSGSWGNYIKVDHGNGIITGYAHIKPGGFNVGWGDRVRAGQTIAYVGNTGASTGCHLHFEVYRNGVRINPAPFLRSRGVSV